MAKAVARVMASGGILAVEAPTGVGKTLAYLLPAVLSGQRVVVSTNTKTLQEQIFAKDIPALEALLHRVGREGGGPKDTLASALMKGRSNYLCLERFDERMRQSGFSFGDTHDSRLRAWRGNTSVGDRAELTWLPENAQVWNRIDARSEVCLGTRCNQYEDCFVVRMRREAQGADVVVVNHHLLFADLALRARTALARDGQSFGEVIPQADVLILDEAHGIEAIASEYFGGSVGTGHLDRLARDVAVFSEQEQTHLGARFSERLEERLDTFLEAKQRFLTGLPETAGREALHQVLGRQAQERVASAGLVDAMTALGAWLSEAPLESGAADNLARRSADLAQNLGFVMAQTDADFVYWIDRKGPRVDLGASPIDVSNLLKTYLFEAFETVVMTSATLDSGDGTCRYFLDSVGAPASTEALTLSSPFEYAKQAALYLPQDAPNPDAQDAIDGMRAIVESLVELVGGGVLVLCTSRRVMTRLAQDLDGRLKFPVLVQGSMPKHELLKTFVEKGNAVLVGTASFWEGVDLPDDCLRCVVIDRLPFDPPDDVLLKAHAQRLEQAGKNPFRDHQLPRAILRLKQGFGRLIRSKRHRGIVCLLDPRVRTRSYGRLILRALPKATQVNSFEALRAWYLGTSEDTCTI
jgi:ATP-dependent DNA helicase DinG